MESTVKTIAICLPSYADPANQFNRCFRQLIKPTGAGRLKGMTHILETQGMVIDKARNTLAEGALNVEPEASHILWIDDDMTFPPDALERLLAHEKDIVGGLCFNRRPPYQPILMRDHNAAISAGDHRFGFCYHYPPDDLFPVDATGGAFILIHRRVYEAIGKDWYTPLDGLSEDLSFCLRAKKAGFDIFVDTGLKIGHIAQVVIDEAFANRNRDFVWDSWRPFSETLPEGTPVASIVIPAFNQNRKYLKAAILSATYQSVPVEVVVVDDGSTVPIEMEGWPENVRVIRHENNKGIATALNTGIAAMTTPWFCWLSSDDYLDPNKVERQLAACEQSLSKASCTRWQALYDGDKHTRIASHSDVAALNQYCSIFGSTIMIHKDVFEECGVFDPYFKYAQDWEFCLRVAEKFKWYYLPEILTTRREGAHNLTAQIEADALAEMVRNNEDGIIKERYK